MVFSLYSIVDGLMVAKGVGEYAMAAVNLAVPFTNVLFSIGVIFAVGTSTIIAIYLGQNQGEKANSLFSQNIVLLTCVGLTITVLVFVFLEPFAVLLGAKGVTYQYTIDYLRGLAPFALCFIISYNMEVLIKTDGYPRLAILTVITGCLANCVLDYIAIFVLNLGVWGAAFATGLSQLLTCIIYLRHFLGGHNTFHFVKFRMDWGIYKRLIPLGFADGVTELCNGVMIFLFNRVILRCLGDDGLVCYTIIAYVNTLIINTMLGISQGSQPLVSYHYGKGDAAGYKKLLRYGFTAVGIMTAVIFAGVMIFAPQIAGIFLGAEKPELLGSEVPCDLSETVVTEYLRGELGYDGVVVTEDLDSNPNAYSANASVQALLAGCDLIYTTDSVGDTLAALQQAVADGTLTEERVNESVYRILLLKCRFGIVTE